MEWRNGLPVMTDKYPWPAHLLLRDGYNEQKEIVQDLYVLAIHGCQVCCEGDPVYDTKTHLEDNVYTLHVGRWTKETLVLFAEAINRKFTPDILTWHAELEKMGEVDNE